MNRDQIASMPSPAPRKLLRDDIYARIKQDVLSCELGPGTRINVKELADSFGVSLSPVRDALHRLETEKLIEVLPRQFYRVRTISLEDALELYEMRMVLECACVERTVRAASDDSLMTLDPYIHGPATATRREWTARNKEFHLRLASLCGNNRLIAATHEITLAFDRLTMASISQSYGAGDKASPGLSGLDDEHGQIIAALKARDAALALQLVRSHIDRSRMRFLESYNSAQAA